MPTLLKSIADDDTVIMFSEDSSLPVTHGVVRIGTENIVYDSNYNGTFYGCTRGADGTVAASHTAGDEIVLVNSYEGQGGGATAVTTDTPQTITGAKTFVSSSLLLQEASGVDAVTIAVASLAAARVYTVPDAGGAASFVMNAGTSSIAGVKTFSTQAIIHGTSTNDPAAAGYVGEIITSNVDGAGAVSSTGTGQFFDVTTISLTAGDWDVTGIVTLTLNGAVDPAYCAMFIGTTAGNTSTGLVNGSNAADLGVPNATNNFSGSVPSYRVSLAGAQIMYLKALETYASGTMKAFGRISARRVR